ncbi:Condensin-2 complex subunit H2 [Papilio xuthus]|uniref:Condensin-2 complex subunit H2 n=1 Tax=Papilio xuthus TaxID=66420 RepID=A0A194QJW4_PAPXU|nr:Condensin-2 complex subunit H2 [Papilio xuthus]
MDADSLETLREGNSHQRVKRWSMNSQRLEEIVAELMKPISDVRRSFDTDLCALLEEYLTEAGLRALEASEGDGPGEEIDVVPNFAELALVLQHSASVYGRKVDYLYQHVLRVSDSLHNSVGESVSSGEEPQTPNTSRRKRKASINNEFSTIELEECPGCRRELDVSRPPPTLPRLYLQLEPRAPTAYDAQLLDYDGEPIGMLADLHVTWRLQNGFLVDDLAEPPIDNESIGATQRPLTLTELQTEFDNGAPPDSPPRCSTPLPITNGDVKDEHDEEPRPMDMLDLSPILDEPAKKKMKRKRNMSDDVVSISVTLVISDEFRGILDPRDIEGFLGWTKSEIAAALLAAKRPDESDDDGFFEQSFFAESPTGDRPSHISQRQNSSESGTDQTDWQSWRAEVVRRAALSEGRVVDIQASAAVLLKHVQQSQHAQTQHGQDHDLVHCDRLLSIAKEQTDVSKLFFATLFLANAGNIEMVQGPPMTTNSFSVRLLSTDERLYRTVMQQNSEQPLPR